MYSYEFVLIVLMRITFAILAIHYIWLACGAKNGVSSAMWSSAKLQGVIFIMSGDLLMPFNWFWFTGQLLMAFRFILLRFSFLIFIGLAIFAGKNKRAAAIIAATVYFLPRYRFWTLLFHQFPPNLRFIRDMFAFQIRAFITVPGILSLSTFILVVLSLYFAFKPNMINAD